MDKKRNKNTRSESEKKKMYEIARMYTCSKGKNDAVAAGIETDTVTMTDAAMMTPHGTSCSLAPDRSEIATGTVRLSFDEVNVRA